MAASIVTMATMHDETAKMSEICRKLERYTPTAFEFLRQGLDYTVQRMHGPLNPPLARLLQFFQEKGIDPFELPELLESESLPDPVEQIVEQLGGALEVMERMNRHVSGTDLCFGLRDYALSRWGLLAPAVLHSWGIRETKDFGRMVFALVDNGVLQKQPDDCVEDFDSVFQFDTAFDEAYKIRLSDKREPLDDLADEDLAED